MEEEWTVVCPFSNPRIAFPHRRDLEDGFGHVTPIINHNFDSMITRKDDGSHLCRPTGFDKPQEPTEAAAELEPQEDDQQGETSQGEADNEDDTTSR